MARLNYKKIAMNLLTCPTIKKAAEESGISEPTLYRLRKNESFIFVLQSVKSEMFSEAMHKAQGYCLESLEVLRAVMNDGSATDSSRVSAARSILELGITLHEDENIVQRIADLERRLSSD